MANLNNINQIGNFQPIRSVETTGASSANAAGSVNFKELLQNSIEEMKDLNVQADQALEKLATGEMQDMHQVMVAIEKSDLTFKTMMAVRNKLLDAYREVMRMNF